MNKSRQIENLHVTVNTGRYMICIEGCKITIDNKEMLLNLLRTRLQLDNNIDLHAHLLL
jgi:hypothetical protein